MSMFRLEGDTLLRVAHCGPVRGPIGYVIPAISGSVAGRSVLERRPIHVADLQTETQDYPEGSAMARELGHRTILVVPLLRQGAPLGTISLRRNEVEPFSDKQIELVTTFADQAVIAIENARLFEEVQARTHELSDALERQTATSEVLKVISQSPNQLRPVLDSIVATAADLCQADFAMIHRLEHDKFRLVAANKVEADYIKWLAQNPPTAGRGSVSGRAVAERATIHIPDVLADPEYARTRSESLKRGHQRTTLGVPLLREAVPIGVIALHRTEVRPFTDKQIELVTTFADQAVIAIENTRLSRRCRRGRGSYRSRSNTKPRSAMCLVLFLDRLQRCSQFLRPLLKRQGDYARQTGPSFCGWKRIGSCRWPVTVSSLARSTS